MNLALDESNTVVAAKALLEELRAISDAILKHEASLEHLRAKRTQILCVVEGLMKTMGEQEKKTLDWTIAETPVARTLPMRLSEPGKQLLERLKTDLEKIWRVEEIQEFMTVSGQNVSDKYASNTLRKLYEQGVINRVGRGKYRVNSTILSIEGLEERDIE